MKGPEFGFWPAADRRMCAVKAAGHLRSPAERRIRYNPELTWLRPHRIKIRNGQGRFPGSDPVPQRWSIGLL